ncbi:MAG TPA: histidinol dehydrogenase [Burkholderiaceae bacterium]|jgi:histidinol dehydrogenase|nr:histidinol dehydrogenase [Burkholderiaceae bacterium]
MKIRTLDTSSPQFEAQFGQLVAPATVFDPEVERQTTAIVEDVRRRGDAALLEYTKRFDRVSAQSVAQLEIPASDLRAAFDALAPDAAEALRAAAGRIRAFHQRQLGGEWTFEEPDGTVLGQRVAPLERVGLYVPGGKAAYPSSVLMNAIPANVAGVRQIVMVVPTPDGARSPLVLAAAHLAGVSQVFAVGGAQAVAALAYGTATLPSVDKIVGPGNAYVAAAKRYVFGVVGIDMIAGPSEILVICDGKTDPDWIAMDLFAQAEHDELAQAILLTPEPAFIDAVTASIARLLPQMPRARIIEASLQARGALIRVRDLPEACELADRVAPEHLEISADDAAQWAERIHHAGAIFLGRYSSEALGDYCAGPNHVLPTAGTARFSSPLGVYDFQKRTSLIHVSEAGARSLGQIAATLAQAEDLPAHARSAQLRWRT